MNDEISLSLVLPAVFMNSHHVSLTHKSRVKKSDINRPVQNRSVGDRIKSVHPRNVVTRRAFWMFGRSSSSIMKMIK